MANIVRIIDPKNAAAEKMRSLVTIFRYCLPGPTRKHVATTAEMFPRVNMKMKPDLQTSAKVASLNWCKARLRDLSQLTLCHWHCDSATEQSQTVVSVINLTTH